MQRAIWAGACTQEDTGAERARTGFHQGSTASRPGAWETMRGDDMGHVPEQRSGDNEQAADELSTLCHDLRQCVTAGLLLTQMPKNRDLDEETRRRLELLHQTLTHAGELLERATVHVKPQHWVLDVSQLVEDCVRVAGFSHRVRVELQVQDAPLVSGDPLLLHRAVDNMIDNAVRAAGDDGDIVVWLGATRDTVWIEVDDNGPGFGRIGHGTGQGLSVVSAAARACEGRLEIASGPGPGTSVRVILPRHNPDVS
ncbi:hypothetical protein GCM10027273_37360 [Nocardioides pakistanensis]